MAAISAWSAAARASGCGRCCSPATACARCGGRGSTSISAIYAIEGTRLRAATVLASSHAVYGVTHLASLARLLPERDPHEDIYEMLERTLDDFDDIGEAAIHLVKFELAMLAELGFGLDLENCAATGETAELIYVSPKSGGAVSRAAGDPWRDRLLRLPAFLRESGGGSKRLVGSGPAGRLSPDRDVPAAPRAGTARAGPFRCPRRVYQCGDEAPGEGGAGLAAACADAPDCAGGFFLDADVPESLRCFGVPAPCSFTLLLATGAVLSVAAGAGVASGVGSVAAGLG